MKNWTELDNQIYRRVSKSKNWTELSVLVDQYVAAHNCKNLGGIEGAMLSGCGLYMDRQEEKFYVFVDVYAPKRLSRNEKRIISGILLKDTPLQYEGESYQVKIRRFETELPRLL